MAVKNRVKITVDGKSFTLVGYESEEHMEKVASYIDKKIKELRENSVTISMDANLAYILTSLNVGDDYFKRLELIQNLETEKKEVDKCLEEALLQQKKAERRVKELEQRLQIIQKQKNSQIAEYSEKVQQLEHKISTMEKARQQAENKLDGYIMAMESNNNDSSRGPNRVKRSRK